MLYSSLYSSPIGDLVIAASDKGVVGIWFKGQKYFGIAGGVPVVNDGDDGLRENEHTRQARLFLEEYFSGAGTLTPPALDIRGTDFQRRVYDELLKIPYGQVVTYGDIAASLKTSPRAAGGAIGRNPISIIVPCHRVVGADMSITGYAGGIYRKIALLELEGIHR